MIASCFHIHTKYSHDALIDPKELVKTACRLKLDAIAVSDHNTTMGAIQTKKAAKEMGADILVIVGQEIKTEYGDILFFGTSENLKGDLFEMLDKAKSKGLLTVLPHPYDNLRGRSSIGINLGDTGMKKLSGKIDAVEVFNSRCFLQRFNNRAEKFAKAGNIRGIAGADAHKINELANCVNLIDCEKKEASLYRAIRAGKITWHGRRTSILNYLRRPLGKLLKF